MVTAIILIHARRDRISETTQALLQLKGVCEVYSVAGEWDIAAIVRVKENDQLADLVTRQMLKLDGIEKTTTLIAFTAYSNYDLDRIFSIGAEGP
jgi:DNA-binding Lrp family transcriptional regulator